LPYKMARWCGGQPAQTDPRHPQQYSPPGNGLNLTSTSLIVNDEGNRLVILFENMWSVNWALEKNKGLVLYDTSRFPDQDDDQAVSD